MRRLMLLFVLIIAMSVALGCHEGCSRYIMPAMGAVDSTGSPSQGISRESLQALESRIAEIEKDIEYLKGRIKRLNDEVSRDPLGDSLESRVRRLEEKVRSLEYSRSFSSGSYRSY